MRLPILFAVILMASPVAVANARSPVTSVGFAKVLNSNNIRVTSFDHQWTVGALGSHYAILDQQNHPMYTWGPETDYHESVTVSFSPDSKRVVVMDQQPKAPQFFFAIVENGQWHAVDHDTDPQMPQYAAVTKAELGKWTSPTTIQLTVEHLAADPPNPNPKKVKYTTTLTFTNDSVTFAAK